MSFAGSATHSGAKGLAIHPSGKTHRRAGIGTSPMSYRDEWRHQNPEADYYTNRIRAMPSLP